MKTNDGLDLYKKRGLVVLPPSEYETLRILNADNVVLDLRWVTCNPGSGEDAIKIYNPGTITLMNYKGPGAITIVGNCRTLNLFDCHINGGHTGVRATQHLGTELYGNFFFRDCSFIGVSHEGVYIGRHNAKAPSIRGVVLENCIAFNCGWDGFQVSNAAMHLKNNSVHNCGTMGQYGQNHALQIGDGVKGKVEGLIYTGTIHTRSRGVMFL